MKRISDEEFMRLASAVPDAEPKRRKSPNRFRSDARFWNEVNTTQPLDSRQKAKLIQRAEKIEARTKQRGRQNGAVSRIGMVVLRALLFKFHRAGKCFPSYAAIQRETGLCRQSIRNALARLEQCGLIRTMRRLERRMVTRVNEITGDMQSFVTTLQASNAYAFDTGHAGLEMIAPPATNQRSFSRLPAAGIFWWQQPSPRRGEKPTSLDYQ